MMRRGAQLEGDAAASDAQAEELERRLEDVGGELDSTARELTDLAAQGDLFSSRVEDLTQEVEEANRLFEQAAAHLERAREEFEQSRAAERVAADREAALAARKTALERLASERGGVDAVVREALARGDEGVLGTLSDFMQAPAGATRAAEAYLGQLADALVVRDRATVERTLEWFGASWTGGGGLVLLPLDRVPASASTASGGLLDLVAVSGEGAPWVRVLLDGVEVPDASTEGRPVTESRGVVRIGDPSHGSGVLERKEELRRIVEEHGAADQELAEGA